MIFNLNLEIDNCKLIKFFVLLVVVLENLVYFVLVIEY